MEALFIFLVKSSGLIGMFYFTYIFLLRKETFFTSNRWYLLAGLISSILMPFIVFTKIVWVNPSPDTFDLSKIPATTIIENEAFEINWYLVFTIAYSIGIAAFLIKLAFDFYSLSKVLKGKTIKKEADYKFIDVAENISPFSYFNYIVYNSSLYNNTELESILEHEKIHSTQNHTIDVLVSRLFCIVFWFNPFVWLYRKEIVQNLEFIADSEASKNISDTKTYQLTLLKITTQENCVAITNHFYQSLIKKRIIMLNKNQSKKRNSWKYAMALPLLGAFLFLFQVKTVAQEKSITKQANETKTNSVDLTSSKIAKNLIPLSKEKEVYINGKKSSEEELAQLDPEEIEKINVIKKSDKQTIFVTTKNLTKSVKITDKDVYVVGAKSTNAELSDSDKNTIDKMELNTSENSPQITKGKKTIIILNGKQTLANFKIDEIPRDQIISVNVLKDKIAKEKYGSDGENGVIEIFTKNETYSVGKIENTTDKPLLIINGKKADNQVAINNINPNSVKSITVLKDKSVAIQKYGKEGENGVIEITTDSPDKIIMKVELNSFNRIFPIQ